MAKLTGSHHPRSSHLKHPTPAARSTTAKHHLAHNHLFSDSDGGVEGDIESSTTAGADTLSSQRISHHYHHHQNSTSSLSTLGTPAAASPSAAVQPSSSTIPSNLPKVDTSPSTRPTNPNSMLIPSPARAAQPLIVTEQQVQEPFVPTKVKEAFNPAALTVEDIQAFVAKAIQGEMHRTYRINPPPKDRPVRVYADGADHLFNNYVIF